jgi:hypothetical protein
VTIACELATTRGARARGGRAHSCKSKFVSASLAGEEERTRLAPRRPDIGAGRPANRSALIRPLRPSDEVDALFAAESCVAIFLLVHTRLERSIVGRRRAPRAAGGAPRSIKREFFDVKETRME